MFSERLQILLTPQQRRHLQQEAKRRGISVTALIREAVNAHLAIVPQEDRGRAYRSIVARRTRFVAPDQLDELVEGRFG
ncbi:hypothetical protein BH24ACT26_BH24ACT26_00130 [soil metagenome]